MRAPSHQDSKRHLIHSDLGSEIIEVALVTPVFLLMLFGFINFALIMFEYCGMTYASRAALRYACMHSSHSFVPMSTTDLNSIVTPFLFKYPSNASTVALSYSGTNTVGSTVSVTVKLVYSISLPGYTMNGLTVSNTASGVIMQ